VNVNDFPRDNGNHNLGAFRLILSSKKIYFGVGFAWRILSIRQACGLFPEVLTRVLNIYCFVLLEYLLRVLKEFLANQPLRLFRLALEAYFEKWE